jgi:hypothetical protein
MLQSDCPNKRLSDGGLTVTSDSAGTPLLSRVSVVAIAFCIVVAGGLLASGADALAASGAPEEPITEACGGLVVQPGVFPLCGTLNPDSSAVVGYHFAYNAGASCIGGSTTPAEAEEEVADIKVSSQVEGLQPGTEYTYCLVAVNSSGETVGQALKFETERGPVSEPEPSEVQTEPAVQTATGFMLSGKLNPENSPTSYYFIYKKAGEAECEDLEGCGPHTTPGGPVTGDTQQEVSPAEVTGLTPATTYVYWLIARNASGTVRGNERTFTVSSPPSTPSQPTSPEPTEPGGGEPSQSGGGSAPSGSPLPGVLPVVLTGAPLTSVLGAPVKVLTHAQKLAKALKLCHRKPKQYRTGCVKQAERRYAGTANKNSG